MQERLARISSNAKEISNSNHANTPIAELSPEFKLLVARELSNEEEPIPPITYFKTCLESLAEFRQKAHNPGKYLAFNARQWQLKHLLKKHGYGLSKDAVASVYNPALDFNYHALKINYGRLEGTDKSQEHNTLAVPIVQKNEQLIPQFDHVYHLQDPNVTWIYGEMVLSGVELKNEEENVLYRTVFYIGKDYKHLERAFEDPWNQKGTRLCSIRGKKGEKKIGVYARPQGGEAGAGQLAFTVADSMEDLYDHGTDIIKNAKLLKVRFPEGEWGGINQVIPLRDGSNLLVGHRAYIDAEKKKHYYPWACTHNPYTDEVTDLGILAERAQFEPSTAKAIDLEDVLYTAGVFKKNGEWYLLVGISDAHTGVIRLEERALFS